MQGKQILNEVAFNMIRPDGAAFTRAAGTGTDTSDGVDTSNCDSVAFMLAIGAVVGGGTCTVTMQESNDDGAVDPYADVAATALVQTVANKLVVTEAYRPLKKWVRLKTVRAVANVTVLSLHSLTHGHRAEPVVQGANVGKNAYFISP